VQIAEILATDYLGGKRAAPPSNVEPLRRRSG
jgi:hypothetical protein